METSFFSGSENLYKYLVTMGLLLVVMTVYYPLKEKQELEILTIKLENDVKALNYKIKENSKDIAYIENITSKNGRTAETNNKILELDKLNQEHNINQFETEKKYEEIKVRRKYISLYKWMFWIFFPLGIFLTFYGFIKWQKAKKYDDNNLKWENEKRELEVKKLRKEIDKH